MNRVYEDLNDPKCGGNVVFQGTVRNIFYPDKTSKSVKHLDFEVYNSMAVKELERLGNEIKEKFPKIEHVSLHHRIGRCDEMEACVYVGVAGRHRKDLFEACDYGIFELKARVPIWKKEIYYDGSESEWLKNCECTGK